ncbi:MAG TPA: exopolysaccharide biosynthesis polyprenyl glycosylphosphotransferase [Actinomycetes bacterium]
MELHRSISRIGGATGPHPPVRARHLSVAPAVGAPARIHRIDHPRAGAASRTSRLVLAGFDVAAAGATVLATGSGSPWVAGYWALVLLLLGVSGSYQNRIALHALNQVPVLVRRVSVPVLAVLAGRAWLQVDGSVAAQAALTLPVLVGARLLSYGALRHARRRRRLLEPALIVGSGAVAVDVARRLRQHPAYGLVPVGFVDSVPAEARAALPLPLLGRVDQLDLVLDDLDVRCVIVADGRAEGSEADWVGMLRAAVLGGAEAYVVPRLCHLGLASEGADTDEVWGIPLQRVRRPAVRTTAWRVKRLLDVAVGASLLVLLGPLLAAIAVAVRLSGPGPVIFRQRRIGQYGRQFELLKFRSMRVSHDGASSWSAVTEDQTAVGRWLRRTSLDELPQLWNVVRGDMSLVGPRPERPHFVQRFTAEIPGYADRHRVAVGMTGWAQCHGLRGDRTSLHDRARFDNFYIERWSLWLDVVAIARTAGTIVRDVAEGVALRRGASAPAPARCLHDPVEERGRLAGVPGR